MKKWRFKGLSPQKHIGFGPFVYCLWTILPLSFIFLSYFSSSSELYKIYTYKGAKDLWLSVGNYISSFDYLVSFSGRMDNQNFERSMCYISTPWQQVYHVQPQIGCRTRMWSLIGAEQREKQWIYCIIFVMIFIYLFFSFQTMAAVVNPRCVDQPTGKYTEKMCLAGYRVINDTQ